MMRGPVPPDRHGGHYGGGGGAGSFEQYSAIFAPGSGVHTVASWPVADSQFFKITAEVQACAGLYIFNGTMLGEFVRPNGASVVSRGNLAGVPYQLDRPAWAPALVIVGNTVELQITADPIYAMTVNVWASTRWSPAALDLLGMRTAALAVVQAMGGFWLEADVVHEDPAEPGYADQWIDQANGHTIAMGAAGQGVQISTLSDAITPALHWSAGRGFLAAVGTFPLGTSHKLYVVYEPVPDASQRAFIWDGGWIYLGHHSSKLGAISIPDPWVDSSALTTGLQLVEMAGDAGASTWEIKRDGVVIGSGAYTTHHPVLSTSPVGIGRNAGVIPFVEQTGNHALWVYLNGIPNPAQAAPITTYIAAKYGGLP